MSRIKLCIICNVAGDIKNKNFTLRRTPIVICALSFRWISFCCFSVQSGFVLREHTHIWCVLITSHCSI